MLTNLAALRAGITNRDPNFFSDFAPDDPRKLQPLSLEQQKKRAKDLLRQWRSESTPEKANHKLSTAQHSIAVDIGFNSWSALKAHVQQSCIARDALLSGEPSALDGDHRALHIRCGNDIQHAMALAGFSGDFLLFLDPFAHGPLPVTSSLEEFIRIRAAYIGSQPPHTYEDAYRNITLSYACLEKALDYDAVYLWYEHDHYDQLSVARLLDYFSDPAKRPPKLKMINITHYPGVKIFNGIGQLPPEAMRVLWRQFTEVTPEQITTGQQAWSAACAPTPDALEALIAGGTPHLPTMAIALKRHLLQLPSRRNGLNLIENLTLKILQDKGDMNAARLFGWYTNHYEPLSFMGDTLYWNVLETLASVRHPAITLDKQANEPPHWRVSLTDVGEKLLLNKADWLTLNDVDYWVGGIHIDTRNGNIFRVDDVFP